MVRDHAAMVVMCYVAQPLSLAGESILVHKRPQSQWQPGWQVATLWPGDSLQGASGLGLMVASSVGGCQAKGLWMRWLTCTPSQRRKRKLPGLPRPPRVARAWATQWSEHDMRPRLNLWWIETSTVEDTGSLWLLIPTEWVLLCHQIWASSVLRANKAAQAPLGRLEPEMCISTKMKWWLTMAGNLFMQEMELLPWEVCCLLWTRSRWRNCWGSWWSQTIILMAHPHRHQGRPGANLWALQSSRGKGEGHGNPKRIFLSPTVEREMPGRTEYPLSYQLAAWLVSQEVLWLLWPCCKILFPW